MKVQPKYTDILTKDFFEKHYVSQKMSYSKIRDMLFSLGYNIHISTLRKYANKFDIGRSVSEASRSLDYDQSYLTEEIIEMVDGFLLGDGHISKNNTVARLSCGLQYEEFAKYLMKGFQSYSTSVDRYKDAGMSSGFQWQGRTRFHPDLFLQYQRWYHDSKKQPPNDVRITAKSVMMWYLGDGSIVHGKNTVTLRLATDGFLPEKVEFLAEQLNSAGITCYRNNDNRVQINAIGVPAFFDFIGKESPVECYRYKFNLPEWRFEAKRMREVADELGVSYNRLAYFVKTGKVPIMRLSENGKPRFLAEHIEVARKLIVTGELY